MSTVSGVLPLFALDEAHWTQLASLGFERPQGLTRAFLEVPMGKVEPLAQELSTRLAGPVLALAGQSNVDGYLLSEFDRGQKVRELAYSRDGDGWEVDHGARREWERDFHFGQELEHVLEDLDDPDETDWSDADLAALKRAYAARDLALLPKLPPASMTQLFALVRANGVQLETGSGVVRRKGFFARLFG
jgi:hypothetical protein